MSHTLEERAHACLRGVAVGDAIGKMTEGYWPWEIAAAYGGPIAGFRDPVQPRSRHRWRRAGVTDDTRFTLLVAESILATGRVDAQDITERIVAQPIKGWPGWERFAAGVRADPGYREQRTGNGAPMRVAPVGILYPPADLPGLVAAVEAACAMTHDTASALSAAAAIAAAVSAALEGRPREAVLDLACEAARLGAAYGQRDRAPGMAEMLEVARRRLAGGEPDLGWRFRGLNPGLNAWEGASFALALVAATGDAREAILAAANHGGDADSIASMAGAILAALDPTSLPAEWVEEVERVNGLELASIARGLVALRLAKGPDLARR